MWLLVLHFFFLCYMYHFARGGYSCHVYVFNVCKFFTKVEKMFMQEKDGENAFLGILVHYETKEGENAI